MKTLLVSAGVKLLGVSVTWLAHRFRLGLRPLLRFKVRAICLPPVRQRREFARAMSSPML